MKVRVQNISNNVRIVGMIVFAAMLMTLALTICAQPAWASDSMDYVKHFKGDVADAFYTGESNSIAISDWDGDGKISAAKSSNTKVATVKLEADPDQENNVLVVKYKKPGKTTISYTFRGKKYKAKLAIYKYTNPLKSLKVGKKEFANKFKKGTIATVKGASGALSVKAAPGWKVKSIEIMRDNGLKKVKNGAKIKKHNGHYDSPVYVILQKKKTKLTQVIYLALT